MTKTVLIMSTVPRREFPQVPVSWIKQEIVRALRQDSNLQPFG